MVRIVFILLFSCLGVLGQAFTMQDTAFLGNVNPPQAASFKTPDQVANLLAWWKADSLVGTNNGDLVDTWTDSSGNSHTATSSGTARAYYTNTTLLGSKPALYFTPTAALGYDIASLTSVATNYTILAVFHPASDPSGNDSRFLDIETGRLIVVRIGGGNGYYGFYDGTYHLSSALSTLAPFVISWVLDSSTPVVYTNGISAGGTLTYSQKALGDGCVLAKSIFGPGDSLAGWLAELCIYNRTLSQSDRESLESGLGQKYGITVTH